MQPTVSSDRPVTRRSPRHETDSSLHSRSHARRELERRHEPEPLGRYVDQHGRRREVVARPASAGSVLVVDRDAATHGDRRLVGHLAADEPAENAMLVCRLYLEDPRGEGRRCRRLAAEDATTVPFADGEDAAADVSSISCDTEPLDSSGRSYRLECVHTGMSIPELRWRRRRPQQPPGESDPVSVREAVGGLESYEPVRTLTLQALTRHRDDSDLSTTALRGELARVHKSPIVLNRRLREVTLATIERQALSMSEIAIRCGRVKRDCRGNESGETSWLARRLGLLPEGGQRTPTPWIHSDVLALIARRGLGVSPREVEQA